MKHYKVLLFLFLVIFPINSLADADIEVLYTRAQVDSIIIESVKSEVTKQTDTIRNAVEKVTHESMGTYITEHDFLISSHLTIIGLVITLLAAVIGIGVPMILNKKNENDLANIKKEMESQNEVFNRKFQLAVEETKNYKNTTEKYKIETEANKLFALAVNEKNVFLQKDLYDQAIIIKGNMVEAYNNRGLVKEQIGDLVGALADFDKAIDLNPSFSLAYNNRGLLKDKMGDSEGALTDFNKAIKLNPENDLSYCNRGYLKYKTGDGDGAWADFDKAKELNPNNADVYNYRGVLKDDNGDKMGAYVDYNRAIRLKPSDADIYYNRGLLRDSMDDYTGALNDYNEAIELNPKLAKAYNNIAYTLFKSAKSDENLLESLKDTAIENVNTAINLDGNDYNFYATKGEIYLALNQYHAAIAEFSHALNINNNDIESYENRSKCFRKLEEREEKEEKKAYWRAKAETDEKRVDELRRGGK